MKSLLFTICILLLTACTECPVTRTCNITSVEDELWLLGLKSTLTNCSCEISIVRGTYSGQTVFFVALTDPLCNGINTPTLFGCEGNEIRSFSESAKDQQEFYSRVQWDDVIYRCKD